MERILLIEDDQALGRGTALALAGEGREIRVAATLAQGWAALAKGNTRWCCWISTCPTEMDWIFSLRCGEPAGCRC